VMMEFQVTRRLPPPIGALGDQERRDLVDALSALATGDDRPLLCSLQDILENRVSEQEFGDYQLFCDEDQREVLQCLAEQVPELAGVRLQSGEA
jgi:hypothetical protein